MDALKTRTQVASSRCEHCGGFLYRRYDDEDRTCLNCARPESPHALPDFLLEEFGGISYGQSALRGGPRTTYRRRSQ